MIKAITERNLWFYRQNQYTTGRVRITEATKNGISRLILEPLAWIEPHGNKMYLSYKRQKYKIITIVGCELSPDVLYELVHISGTDYYKLKETYFFNLSDYEE